MNRLTSVKYIATSSVVKRVVFWGLLSVLLIVFAIVAPYVTIHDPIATNLNAVNQAPSSEYLLGTDAVGRCILCRILAGTQSSLLAALIVVALCFVVGSLLGAICGFIGGKTDSVFMRITDAFMAFPQLVLSIAVAGLLGGGLVNAVIALCVPGWTRFARLARGQVLALKGRTFIQAEQMSGLSKPMIAVKHIFPSVVPVLFVTACLDFGSTILNLAGLSFLGLGALPPTPELGSMINQAAATFQLTPWAVFAPGAMIFILVLVFNMFGDAVNDFLGSKQENIDIEKGDTMLLFHRSRSKAAAQSKLYEGY